MLIRFAKYQGTGNDFVIIDNRFNTVTLTTEQIHHLCDRRFGIGADGLMLLQEKPGYDFEMKYYNADGKEGSMCGNGGRCMVQFANDRGIHRSDYFFIAVDGPHEAKIAMNGWVHLKMKDVNAVESANGDAVLDTGSPHYIRPTANLQSLNVFEEGRKIRYNERFSEKGINVNFIEPIDNGIFVRTYERGVEDETYSCGTGVTAAALTVAKQIGYNRIDITTLGGKLAVEYTKASEQAFHSIWLCGPATFVFEGQIEI